jgi:hypothetical protein
MDNFTLGTKLKKTVEVNELIIYPIFRKVIDALSGEVLMIFKANEHTITKVVCGNNLYPSIQVFDNDPDTLSLIYWHNDTTEQEYKKYLQQTKDCIR